MIIHICNQRTWLPDLCFQQSIHNLGTDTILRFCYCLWKISKTISYISSSYLLLGILGIKNELLSSCTHSMGIEHPCILQNLLQLKLSNFTSSILNKFHGHKLNYLPCIRLYQTKSSKQRNDLSYLLLEKHSYEGIFQVMRDQIVSLTDTLAYPLSQTRTP